MRALFLIDTDHLFNLLRLVAILEQKVLSASQCSREDVRLGIYIYIYIYIYIFYINIIWRLFISYCFCSCAKHFTTAFQHYILNTVLCILLAVLYSHYVNIVFFCILLS